MLLAEFCVDKGGHGRKEGRKEGRIQWKRKLLGIQNFNREFRCPWMPCLACCYI